MVYDLMRRHFNFTLWPGIIYDDIESSSNESLNNNNNLFSNLDLEDKQATSESTETVYSTSSKKHKKGHVTKKGNKHDKMSNSKNYKVADINGSMEEDLNVKSLSEENKNLLQKMEEALKAHEVKLAAAFARIRIERKANGTDLTEQLENILPMEVRNKESSACN